MFEQAATTDLSSWKSCTIPQATELEGVYTKLERLSVAEHAGRGLYDAVVGPPDSAVRFKHLPEHAPTNMDEFVAMMKAKEESKDPMFYAIVDKATNVVGGYISLMRIDPENGVCEIGHVYMGPGISQSCVATETVYLLLKYVLNELGYRRVEWKCDSLNQKSRRAAGRFGFQLEGTFRKHKVVKGLNRDTMWFSMTDDDWKGSAESCFVQWLDPSNFTADGKQINNLVSFRK